MTAFEFRLHPLGPEVAFANVLYPLAAAARSAARARAGRGRGPDRRDQPDRGARARPAARRLRPGAARRPVRGGRSGCSRARRTTGWQRSGRCASWEHRSWTSAGRCRTSRLRPSSMPTSRGPRCYWKSLYLAVADDARSTPSVEPDRRPPVGPLDDRPVAQRRAMSAVPAEATAFGPRDPGYILSLDANWERPGRRRHQHRLGPCVLATVAIRRDRRRLPELPGPARGGRVPHPRQLRPHVRPAGRGQARVRPRQRVPPEPERGAGRRWLTPPCADLTGPAPAGPVAVSGLAPAERVAAYHSRGRRARHPSPAPGAAADGTVPCRPLRSSSRAATSSA